jgi:hypothetical protein
MEKSTLGRIKMMKMRNILILLLVILSSCENQLKKTIFEPLPAEIIQKYALEDSTFSDKYKIIRTYVDSIYFSKTNFPQYSSLTYSDLFNYFDFFEKENKNLNESEDLKKLWENKFGGDIQKFKEDSIKFHNYILENDYHNFLEIEVQKVSRKTSWLNSYTSVDLTFKPKRNIGIRKISGYVTFLSKTEKFDSLDVSAVIIGESAFFGFSGFSKGVFNGSTIKSIKDLSYLEDLTVDLIKQKYKIHFLVTDLVVEDRFIDTDFEEVPYEMKEVLRAEYKFYKEFYISEHINSNFKAFPIFSNDSAFSIAKNKFPLVVDFFTNGEDKYYELKSKEKNLKD